MSARKLISTLILAGATLLGANAIAGEARIAAAAEGPKAEAAPWPARWVATWPTR